MATKTKDARPVVHVGVVLDRSGSMAGRVHDTISGFNDYLKSLVDDDKVAYRMTRCHFDDEFLFPVMDVPVVDVAPLTPLNYVPRGSTALFDAFGMMIQRLTEKAGEDRVLCIVITDGAENASREWTQDRVFSLVREKEQTGRWTFVFLGADQDAMASAATVGVFSNAYSYKGARTHAMYNTLAASNKGYSAGVATGQMASRDFFSPEAEPEEEEKP